MIIYILSFTFLGGVASLLAAFLLLVRHDFAQKISLALVSLAAGTLLATAFLNLLPEALEQNAQAEGIIDVPLFILLGVVIFFLIERFLLWFHHHHEQENDIHPATTLVLLGDSLHNFIDGVAIAASFFVNIPLGVMTAIAVFLHEIPQEIGDMAVLLHGGFTKNRAIFFNFLSALTALFGAILAIIFRTEIVGVLPLFLSLTAGFFIYIAAADLIPELKHKFTPKNAVSQVALFLLGISVVLFLNSFLTF